MCEAKNFVKLKLEVSDLRADLLEKIDDWKHHFEWLRSLDKGYPIIDKSYIRICKCGSELHKINGFLICRDCGFNNEIYLQCPKCKKNRSFKLNKKHNKCLVCGHTWKRKITDNKKLYFKIRRFRKFLKDFYHKKEKKILKQVDKLQSKFNRKIKHEYEKLVIFREKRFREMMNLGEEI